MTNQEEGGFLKRWEIRGSKVEGGSSSDDGGEATATEKQPVNTITDLVLYSGGDGAVPESIHVQDKEKLDGDGVKADEEKKESPSTKKKAPAPAPAQKKPAAKKRKFDTNWRAMMKDLKSFGASLVQELATEREKMFANMQEEMRKIAAERRNKGVVMDNNMRLRQRLQWQMQNNVASTSAGSRSKAVADAMKLANERERLRQAAMALPTTFPTSLLHQSQMMNRAAARSNSNDHVINPRVVDNSNLVPPGSGGLEYYNFLAAQSLSRRLGAEHQPQPPQQHPNFAIKYQNNWVQYAGGGAGSSHGMDSRFSIGRHPSTSQAPVQGRDVPSSIRVPRSSEHGESVAPRSTQGQRDGRGFNI